MNATFWFKDAATLGVSCAGSELALLRHVLTYDDPEVVEKISRLRRRRNWYARRGDDELWKAEMEGLKSQVKVCLLKSCGDHYETMSGFADRLRRRGYVCTHDIRGFDFDSIGFPIVGKQLPPRYYQREAAQALLEARHAGISLPTGGGKSWIITDIVRRLGDRTIVMAPSVSIARQLYRELLRVFGPKRVGLYGDGSKHSDKQIVVGIAASLTKADGKHLENLKKVKVFIADESHLTPARTFEHVCQSIAKDAIFRCFLSATQMRNDGTEIVLEGIVGPIVYEKTLKELVEDQRGPFLARPRFFTVPVRSPKVFWSADWQEMAGVHLWGNKELHKKAAQLANKFVATHKVPVLILIDHVDQLQHLQGWLEHPFQFAHGPLDKERAKTLESRFHKVDNEALVEEFNAGRLPILVGTSCITTGTDLRPTAAIIWLMSGESEIKVRQGIGRGTRLVEGKTDFAFVDFDVDIPGIDVDVGRYGEAIDEKRTNPLKRHYRTRSKIYAEWEHKRLAL